MNDNKYFEELEKSVNHYFISYAGNKRKEVKNIIEYFEKSKFFNDITTIIEPYCGTSAFSYYLNLKYPNKYKFILNDLSPVIFRLNSFVKNSTYEELKKFEKELYDTIQSVKDNKEEYKAIIKSKTFIGLIMRNFYYQSFPGLFPTTRNHFSDNRLHIFDNKENYINFLQSPNVTLSNVNAMHFLDINNSEFNNKQTFLYLDPPYILTDNTYYELSTRYNGTSTNFYEFMALNSNLLTNDGWVHYKFFLHIISNWLTDLIFTPKFKLLASSDVKYSLGNMERKKTNKNPNNKHLLFSNSFCNN